jgi:hypothetical protein
MSIWWWINRLLRIIVYRIEDIIVAIWDWLKGLRAVYIRWRIRRMYPDE